MPCVFIRMNTGDPGEDRTEEVASVLRMASPAPPPAFVDALERRLIQSNSGSGWPRRPALMATLGACAVTGIGLALALAGANPLAGDNKGAEADDGCRYVVVTQPVRVPIEARNRDGTTTLRFERRLVERGVKRCP